MKHVYITLALAASFAALDDAHAQLQQFGRDSVYAVPGKSSKATSPAVAAPVNRFGRDSVYVTQTPNAHSTPVSADAKSPQQNGRDSVFAYGSPNPPAAASSETKVGSATSGHGG
ncbi:MAG: hypothetical protein C5B46_06425 [Proteobacteria bacterium]|nr:MAG: hypothetical protein C5B46_06425 [Pseudomonadota bacterium]